MKTDYRYYITCNNTNKLFLRLDAIKDNSFYSVIFQIENNSISLCSIKKDYKSYNNIFYKVDPKKIEITDDKIIIDLDCHFKFSDDDIIYFNLNKEFNKKNIEETQYDTFKKANEEFKIKYIENMYAIGEYKNFLYYNIEPIFDLICKAEKNSSILIGDYVKNKEYMGKYKYLSKNNGIKLAQSFLNRYDINTDIIDLMDKKILEFKKSDKEALGRADADEVSVCNSNDIKRSAVLIHELLHYYNETNNTNEYKATKILTESVAYTYELIFFYEMLNTNYYDDIIKLFKMTISVLKQRSSYCYSPILTALLMKNKGYIKEEDIEEYLEYDKYMKEMKYSMKEEIDFEYDLKTIIGIIIAIKNLKNYIEDNNYINTIKEYNDSISTKHTFDCLSLIGINSFDDLISICNNDLKEVFDIMTSNEVEKEKVKTKKLENTI